MSAQKGKLLVLSIGSGGESETFAEIMSARSNGISINNEQVDITAKDSAGWKELLAGAGIQSAQLSISGVFKDSASEETLRASAFANTIKNYELAFGNGDVISGAFAITSYERTGEHNGEETYSVTLDSAGVVGFEAA